MGRPILAKTQHDGHQADAVHLKRGDGVVRDGYLAVLAGESIDRGSHDTAASSRGA